MPHEHKPSGAHRGRSLAHEAGSGRREHASSFRRRSRESRDGSPAEGGGAGSARPRHRGSSSPGGSAGKASSLVCLLFAGLGFAAVLVATVLSRSDPPPAHSGLNLFAGACAGVSLAAGVRAQLLQRRHWSRRVKRRLLVGAPAALCTLLAVLVTWRERLAPHAGPSLPAPALAAARDSQPEDDSLVKPGWYGETLANGVLLVVTAFEENAAESRRFNRGLFKPVSYATLSVINTGSSTPVTLRSPQVALLLETGERAVSLALRDLLSHGSGAHREVLERLAEQQDVTVGGMIPDIPVCLDAPFDWSRVKAVEVVLGSGPVAVPGRLMTVAEKQASLFSGPSKRSAATTNVTAEAWFKDL